MAEARQAREHPLLKAGAGGTACDGESRYSEEQR